MSVYKAYHGCSLKQTCHRRVPSQAVCRESVDLHRHLRLVKMQCQQPLTFGDCYSLYNEDRNLQRLRERERRSQEVHQEKELCLESAPLFGEPYKTNKGDELSSRIQRMLGDYEDVREVTGSDHQNLISTPKILKPQVPNSGGPSRPSHTDKAQTPFQNPSQFRAGPPGPPSETSSKAPTNSFVPERGQTTSSYMPTLGLGLRSPDPHLRRSKVWPEMEACASFPPMLPVLTPPAEPLSPLHSSDSEPPDVGGKDTPTGDCGSPACGRYRCREDVGRLEAQKDVPAHAAEAASLPSQTFPPPLPSKPMLVMPQKPTAYVRPMDGQDQAPVESPDLKPSQEDFHGQSYKSLPDLKSNTKPSFSKLKMPPYPIETLSNETNCVEEILREMTHSWPPPLTEIHTPSTTDPPKFGFPTKESHHLQPGISEQKCCKSSPKSLLLNCQQGSSTAQGGVVSVHSSGGESDSSSDSESTSGSESDSGGESGNEDPPPPQRSSPSASKTDERISNKWQLDNWLVKVNQQNSNSESLGDNLQSPSPGLKRPQQVDEGEVFCAQKEYNSQTSPIPPSFTGGNSKLADQGSQSQPSCQTSTSHADDVEQRRMVGNKYPSSAPCSENLQAVQSVESVKVSPLDKKQTSAKKPKVKTKTSRKKPDANADAKIPTKCKKKKPKGSASKGAPRLDCKGDGGASLLPSPARVRQPSPPARTSGLGVATKKREGRSPTSEGKRGPSQKSVQVLLRSLVVKIQLSLLSRVPQPGAKPAPEAAGPSHRKRLKAEKRDADAPPKVGKKRPAEKDEKSQPRKKSKPPSSSHGSTKAKVVKGVDQQKDKRAKKGPSSPAPPATQEPLKGQGHRRQGSKAPQDPSQTPAKHKSLEKHSHHVKASEKIPKSTFAFRVPAQPSSASSTQRPLLKFEDRQHPVEYHMKAAKKLKHKADATPDKVGKAFNYLDAAMSFVESGIAMETDPETPKSAYTMFSETVDLIRFIMKLKNSLDPSAPASEKDFAVLCMRCQSLLQMAMFRHKREVALKYSRTLTGHFKSSLKSTRAPSPSKSMGIPSPMSPMSPASSVSSGSGSNHSGGVAPPATVAIPQVIQQVASSYVNITALFLSAHDTWEQAEALTQRGSGLLSDLDSALGPLNLTSCMSSLVRHTRQGLHWLRLDANVV